MSRPQSVHPGPCLYTFPLHCHSNRVHLNLQKLERWPAVAGTVAYVRVSTEKQAEKGFSLEVQTEKVRAMAVVQGVELLEVIVDRGESAKSLDRPGMARLLELVARKAIDRVIVAKLDRLTRSVKDLANLLETIREA